MASGTPVLEVTNLTKKFSATVLADLQFSINAGESVALVGANGAGKSTLIKIILGLIFPSAGSVKVFGNEPGSTEALKHIGYLPEIPGFWGEVSAKYLLRTVGAIRGIAPKVVESRMKSLLSAVGLQVRGDRWIGGYSKGMLQRTGLAQALLHDPALLILDEPMSGLDPRAQEKLRGIILELKQKGKTFIISSHSLEDIRSLCTRVIVLEKTKIVADGPAQEVLEELVKKYRSQEPWDEDPIGQLPLDWGATENAE
jgi:ABC-2 type transport system ATP-binding protein